MADNVIPFPRTGRVHEPVQAEAWDVEAELALAKRLASGDVAMAPLAPGPDHTPWTQIAAPYPEK